MSLPKWAVIGALWLWFAVALFTHYGAASPYSYTGAVSGLSMRRIDGLVVNHDAPSVQPVTRFFYDAEEPDYAAAHNLKLPLHSFLVACAMSFVRSYLLANYIVNLLALWLLSYVAVTLADQLAYPRAATVVASLTCAFLPVYTHYIGQPVQYIAGITINFLVVLAVMAGVRDALRLGILTAVLTLNYDPYVYLAALITWIAWSLRWKRSRDWTIYAVTAFAPVIAWRIFLGIISNGTISEQVQDQFVVPLLAGWQKAHWLTPFVNAQIGLVVASKMTLAMIYWPALVLGLIVWRPRFSLPAMLALFFVLEQLVTAAYDWENNPRRAIPLVLAFSCAYFWMVREKIHLRGWRIALVAVMACCAFITLSDTLTGNPVIGYSITSEAMRAPVKELASVARTRLTPAAYPKLMSDETARWWDVDSARVTRPALFVFINVFAGAFVVALLFMLRDRTLLPRYFPIATAVVLTISLGARLL